MQTHFWQQTHFCEAIHPILINLAHLTTYDFFEFYIVFFAKF